MSLDLLLERLYLTILRHPLINFDSNSQRAAELLGLPRSTLYHDVPMKSFWGKLKQEWLNGQHFRTHE